MSSPAELFKAMFKEEIEESLGSVKYLADKYVHKLKNGEITNYVYNANEVFLAQEVSGLGRFISFIDSIDLDGKTPEDLATMIRNMVQKKMKEYEDPEALYGIVNRKLEKTLKYVQLGQK
ncbi:MAG: hypothetical protein LBT68_08300 [Spirochaetales bacterium]|jgi:hypothetical protein|nr:hypothetical protein [Spirochaetales bacterium]